MAEDSHFTRMEEDVFPGQDYEDKVSNTSLDNYMWDLGPEGDGLTYSEHEMFHNGMEYGQFHTWSIFHILAMVTFHA